MSSIYCSRVLISIPYLKNTNKAVYLSNLKSSWKPFNNTFWFLIKQYLTFLKFKLFYIYQHFLCIFCYCRLSSILPRLIKHKIQRNRFSF